MSEEYVPFEVFKIEVKYVFSLQAFLLCPMFQCIIHK